MRGISERRTRPTMTETSPSRIGDGASASKPAHGWRSPTARICWLSIVMVAGGAVLTLYARHWGAPVAPFHLAWWLLVPAFVLGDSFVFHLEVREEAHSFTLSELPLVVGLFFASPWAIIAGRIVGEAIYFGFRRRQELVKL